MGYYDMPWVKPFWDWLNGQGAEALTVIGIVLGAITIGIALFAPPVLNLAWIVYMLSP